MLQKLLGELSFAQTASMGKVARAMLRPLYIQSHSDAASRALFPSALRALEWWYHALSSWGPRVLRSEKETPDLVLYTDAEGSGGCAALVFSTGPGSRCASLFKYKMPRVDQALANGTNLIFALELFTAVAALCALRKRARDAAVLIFMDNDAAAQVLTRGGSNHPLINQLVGSFWSMVSQDSTRVWIERVCSKSNPADAPSRDRGPELDFRDEGSLPPL